MRPDLSWLPDQDRLVLTAREGEIGFVAIYDDGHVFEFAFSEVEELAGAVAGDATVVLDDDARVGRRDSSSAPGRGPRHPIDSIRRTTRGLMLVKLLIGVGRARRGEVLNGGQFVRSWAVRHARPGDPRPIRRPVHDAARHHRPDAPVRADFPEWAARIAALLEAPVEDAARGSVRVSAARCSSRAGRRSRRARRMPSHGDWDGRNLARSPRVVRRLSGDGEEVRCAS